MTFTAEIDKGLAATGAQRELAQLLDDIRAFIRRYVVVTDHEFVALSLWVTHTFTFLTGENTPYINITSPTPGAGKSQLLRVLKLLVNNPKLADSFTTAALTRTVDEKQPTLLVDEMDAFFGGSRDRAETMRGILNGGFSKEGTVGLCDGPQHTLRELKTFCPKAFAGIGRDHLPETVRTRSVPVAMKRKRRDEKVSKLRQRKVRTEVDALRERIEAWAVQDMASLEGAEPEPALGLSDRGDDVAEPLLAIADRAGEKWAKKARQAMTALLGETNRSDDDRGVLLLCDIRTEWPGDEPFIPTKKLLEKLHVLDERPWATSGRGDAPMTSNALARLLNGFGIFSRSNGQRRGYDRAAFEDAWARYEVVPGGTPQASNRQEGNDGGAGSIDALTVHAGDGGKVADPLPQERELPVQQIMLSAKDHDKRVQFENEWIRRSKEKKTEVTEI